MGRTQTQRWTRWAVAASVMAHVGVLAALLLQRWTLYLPSDEAGPPEPIIPVLLVPHAPLGARGGSLASGKLRLHQRQLRAEAPPLPAAARPLLVPQDQARTPEAAQPSRLSPSAAPGSGSANDVGPPALDLRAALRHGVAGCANAAAMGMTRAERERCDDQLAAGAKGAAPLTLSLDPRIQAYYDAVAKAKEPEGQMVPSRARGALGLFDPDPRHVKNGHLPMIGCAIPFGPGEKPKAPSHWLTLGPCFIAPPQGPLSVEADITPPDQDLSHPPPRSGPLPPPGVRHEIAVSAPASKPTLERDKGKDADGARPPQ